MREFPDGQQPEEPWFVPNPQGTAEDDGWLFSFVSDVHSSKSSRHIPDASKFLSKPTAVIAMPGRIPAGVHGSWIDDADLK